MSRVSYPVHASEKTVRKAFNRKSIHGGSSLYRRFHNNDTQAFVPEQWAEESVRVLTEQMIFGATVHRDFEPIVAKYGETIHTRKVNEFEGQRKQNDLDDLEDQDVVATDIEVKLNQRVYVSFVIGDGERSKSFKDLVNEYLIPGMRGNSRLLDRALGCQVYQYLENVSGGLGTLTKSNAHDYLLDAREVMNANKVGAENRWLGLATRSETEMQKTEIFKKANEVGDDGTALANAILGRKAGFNTFLSLNTPSVRGATKATATTTTASTVAGVTVVPVTAATNLPVGAYFTVAGDMTPLRVTGVSTLDITVSRPLKYPTSSGAAVQPYATGLVNQAAAVSQAQTHASAASGYPANWMKKIVVDGTGVPKAGQLVSFATAGSPNVIHTPEYGILSVTDDGGGVYSVMLDRPLETAILNNDVVCYGPDGDFNFAYQREALTLVNRPLALPLEGAGARAALATFENISLRITITYDGKKEGHRVTCTGLFGMKPLDIDRGAVLLG